MNQKTTEVSESVKPILNRDKQSAHQKTANIEIQKGNGNNRSASTRKSSVEEKVTEENHGDNSIESTKDVVKAEFKNDLIFDLDI